MQDEKQIKRRLIALRDAADILIAIRGDLPTKNSAMIEQTAHNLRIIATWYGELEQALEELSRAPRKDPKRARTRVTFTDRTRPRAPLDSMHRTTPADVGDYDIEQELRDTLGHDIPDGSD